MTSQQTHSVLAVVGDTYREVLSRAEARANTCTLDHLEKLNSTQIKCKQTESQACQAFIKESTTDNKAMQEPESRRLETLES